MRWVAVSLWLACGGKAVVDGKPAGGAGGNVPGECGVATSLPPPYSVTFRVINTKPDQPWYIHAECQMRATLTSCADGFSKQIVRSACTPSCSGPTSCAACGACPTLAARIGHDEYVEPWGGADFTAGTNSLGCECHHRHDQPAGRYRIRVPVYASEAAAQSGSADHDTAVDFDLPAASGEVVVDVSR